MNDWKNTVDWLVQSRRCSTSSIDLTCTHCPMMWNDSWFADVDSTVHVATAVAAAVVLVLLVVDGGGGGGGDAAAAAAAADDDDDDVLVVLVLVDKATFWQRFSQVS
jgi:hypothetical protein